MTIKQYFSNSSLSSLVIAVAFLVFYIPSLGLLLLHRVIDNVAQGRLEQQRALVQKIDESINYDNRITKVTRKIVLETSNGIEQEFYNDDGELIAIDVSVKILDDKMQLKSRTYYDKYKNIVARDVFGPLNDVSAFGIYTSGIVKQREYLNQDGEVFLREYFDEHGVGYPNVFLVSLNTYELRENAILSPFPPLFFFYR